MRSRRFADFANGCTSGARGWLPMGRVPLDRSGRASLARGGPETGDTAGLVPHRGLGASSPIAPRLAPGSSPITARRPAPDRRVGPRSGAPTPAHLMTRHTSGN